MWNSTIAIYALQVSPVDVFIFCSQFGQLFHNHDWQLRTWQDFVQIVILLKTHVPSILQTKYRSFSFWLLTILKLYFIDTCNWYFWSIQVCHQADQSTNMFRLNMAYHGWTFIHTCYFKTLSLRMKMLNPVKSFNFVGTKFRGLTMMDMFVDTWVCGFQIIRNITKVKKYFIGILN